MPQLPALEQGLHPGTMMHDGYERSFLRYHPALAVADPTTPRPLLFVLHGGGGDGQGMRNLTIQRFEALAEADGWLLIYPDGYDGRWNDDRTGTGHTAHDEDLDDVGFIAALIELMAADCAVDRARVFSTGISNGGMMSLRLARELPGTFAGIAPVAMHPTVETGALPWPQATSICWIIGDSDPLVPSEGGEVIFLGTSIGTNLSYDASTAFFLEQLAITGAPSTSTLPDLDGETTTRRSVWPAGDRQSRFHRYRVEGGGHTWPGGLQYLHTSIIGPTSQDFVACDLIWDFFSNHARQPAPLRRLRIDAMPGFHWAIAPAVDTGGHGLDGSSFRALRSSRDYIFTPVVDGVVRASETKP